MREGGRRRGARSDGERLSGLLDRRGARKRLRLDARRQNLSTARTHPARHRRFIAFGRKSLRSVPDNDPVSGRQQDLSRLRHKSENVPHEGKWTGRMPVAPNRNPDCHAGDVKHVRTQYHPTGRVRGRAGRLGRVCDSGASL
jgi:hypothetical protein